MLPPTITIPTFILASAAVFGFAVWIVHVAARSPAAARGLQAAAPFLAAGLVILLLGLGLRV